MTFVEAGPDFRAFVRGFRHSSFRLETRDRYNEPNERDHYQRWLAGERVGDWWRRGFLDMVEARTGDGARMARVRVVSEPASDYTRFGFVLGAYNVAAGEDIRYLPRGRAAQLDLPGEDWWLIDSTRVGVIRFGDDDILLGAEIIDDPAAVVQYNAWRDVALHYAVPLREYATT